MCSNWKLLETVVSASNVYQPCSYKPTSEYETLFLFLVNGGPESHLYKTLNNIFCFQHDELRYNMSQRDINMHCGK